MTITASSGGAGPVLRLLGTPHWAPGADGPQLAFGTERRHQLLAYLACVQRWVHRDELAEWLWPERQPQAARSNLRKVLASASIDGLPAIERRGPLLRWAPATDLLRFEAALAQRRHGEALGLYAGPLLQGLDNALPRPALEWLQLERERLHQRWQAAALAHLDALASDPAASVDGAERVLRTDPLFEAAVIRLGQACEALGDVPRARRALALHRRHLAAADIAPSAALLGLEARWQPAAGPAVPQRLNRPLRDAAVQGVLDAALDTVADDAHWPVLLERLRTAVHAIGTMWVGNSFSQPAQGFLQTVGLAEDLCEPYLSRYQVNPWTLAAVHEPPGRWLNLTALVDRRQLFRTDFFQEINAPQGIQTILALQLPMGMGHDTGGIGVAFGDWSGAAIEEAHRLLQRLAPVLSKVARASLRWRASSARHAGFEAAFDGLPLAAFVVAADGRLLLANRLAERLLSAADGFGLQRGLLCAATDADTQALRRRVAQASHATARLDMADGPLLLHRGAGRQPLRVGVAPVGELRDRTALSHRPGALVYVADPASAV